MRLTGDCPLADPALIDELVELHLTGGYDYSSNCWDPSYPDGLDAEILSAATLDLLAGCAHTPTQREHVTYYIRQHEAQFKIGKLARQPSLAHLRWTVDEPADFALVEQIYQRLYPSNPAFATDDILALLAREPQLATLKPRRARERTRAPSLAPSPGCRRHPHRRCPGWRRALGSRAGVLRRACFREVPSGR